MLLSMEEERKLGLRIRTIRRAKDITQKQLAERTGLDQSQISKIERGEAGCSVEGLIRIARVLGVSFAELMGETVREPGEVYQSATNPRAAILADYQAPAGLRDLAQDKALVEALQITPEEWRALASLKPPAPLSKEGYVQVLFALRSGRKDEVSAA